MKTKIWDRTTFVWGIDGIGGPNTDIPVNDRHDKEEKLFHIVHGLRITPILIRSQIGKP